MRNNAAKVAFCGSFALSEVDLAKKKGSEETRRDAETSMPEAKDLETFDKEPEIMTETPSEVERDLSAVTEIANEAPVADSLPSEEEPEEVIFELEEDPEAMAEDPVEGEPVVSTEASAERDSEPVTEEVDERIAAWDDVATVVMPEAPAEPSPAETESAPEEGSTDFVMDDEYMKAFLEEGAMDDYIYGGNFEEKQELLEKIQDNAEVLAEEGTELLEKKEEQKKEPVYNERGELLDDNGKAIIKRTLENKLIVADTRERRYYNKLKNAILAYQGVKSEMLTATEVFRVNKQTIARVSLAGFTRVYFALDPDEFDVDRYKQADRTEIEFEDTRMLVRVRNDDEFAIATDLDLIAAVKSMGLVK